MPPKRKGFFTQEIRPEDELARQREVAALLVPRRTVVQDLGVDRVQPNPFQARRSFTGIEELAEAIRVHGFTSRLRVRPHPVQVGQFQLVFGERRLRAAKIAGLLEVPCDVGDHTDEEMIEIGLAENIQRRDLDPLEEAQAFQNLIDHRGYSIRRLAERIGKDKSYIEDRLALLRTPDDVQEMIVQRPDSMRAAREIAKLDAPEQRAPLIEGIVSGTFSTADVREIVRETRQAQQADAGSNDDAPQRAEKKAKAAKITSLIQKMLSGDLYQVHTMVARWRRHLTSLNAAEREALTTTLAEMLVEIQSLDADLVALKQEAEEEEPGTRD